MIEIAPYDSTWPARFEAEAAKLRAALGASASRIDHVGSTSVPGLAAKPVIDIQISVASLDGVAEYSRILERLGYSHVDVGEFDRVYPFFQKPVEWPSSHHVHLCVAGGEQERRHLAFRDYLRCHPAVAAEYAELKRDLAARHSGESRESREAYSLAKTDFIIAVLERAVSGQSSTGD